MLICDFPSAEFVPDLNKAYINSLPSAPSRQQVRLLAAVEPLWSAARRQLDMTWWALDLSLLSNTNNPVKHLRGALDILETAARLPPQAPSGILSAHRASYTYLYFREIGGESW